MTNAPLSPRELSREEQCRVIRHVIESLPNTVMNSIAQKSFEITNQRALREFVIGRIEDGILKRESYDA